MKSKLLFVGFLPLRTRNKSLGFTPGDIVGALLLGVTVRLKRSFPNPVVARSIGGAPRIGCKVGDLRGKRSVDVVAPYRRRGGNKTSGFGGGRRPGAGGGGRRRERIKIGGELGLEGIRGLEGPVEYI